MRAPLPAIHTARVLSFSLGSCFSRRTFTIFLILCCISRFYRCILSSSPMRIHCTLSSRHFPISLVLPPFVLLLRHGGAFECNHQLAAVFSCLFFSFFLSLFFCLPREVWYALMARYVVEKRKIGPRLSSNLLSSRRIRMNYIHE